MGFSQYSIIYLKIVPNPPYELHRSVEGAGDVTSTFLF